MGKKTIISILVGIFVIVFGVVAVTLWKNSQDSDKKNPVIENTQDDDEQQSEGGLQIQEDDEEAEVDSSDASGSWEDDENELPSGENTPSNNTPGDSESDEDEEGKDDENTLIDDVIWGDIF